MKYFVFVDFIEKNYGFQILQCGMSFLFISQKKSLNSNEAEAEKPTGGLKKSCSVPFCDLMQATKALKN